MRPDRKIYTDQEPTLAIDKVGIFDDKLKSDLEISGGRAAFIIHPFYRQRDVDRGNFDEAQTQAYYGYVENLKAAISKYRELQLPLILLEEARKMSSLDELLKEMGIESGRVFIVPTQNDSSRPSSYELYMFIHQLKASGLQRAIALGSNFWTRDLKPWENPTDFFNGYNIPPIAKSYKIGGCVGSLMNRLNSSGVYTTHGFATFPNPEDRIRHPDSTF